MKYKPKALHSQKRATFMVQHDSKRQHAGLKPIRVSKYAKAKRPKG